MQAVSAIVIDSERHADWLWLTLGAPPLTTIQAGQFVAVRCTNSGSYDPLLRAPVFVAAIDQPTGTCNLLLAPDDPAYSFLGNQPRGAALDLLGPIGHGWTIEPAVRTIALVGAADAAASLFALAQRSTARGLSVTVLIGADARLSAPAPFLLPAAAEYNVGQGTDAATAALALLDDQLVRWADLIAIALPPAHWSTIAQRVRNIRLQWNRNFVQAIALPPLACCVGVCGVCAIETRHAPRRACVDGPVFDLRDLIR